MNYIDSELTDYLSRYFIEYTTTIKKGKDYSFRIVYSFLFPGNKSITISDTVFGVWNVEIVTEDSRMHYSNLNKQRLKNIITAEVKAWKKEIRKETDSSKPTDIFDGRFDKFIQPYNRKDFSPRQLAVIRKCIELGLNHECVVNPFNTADEMTAILNSLKDQYVDSHRVLPDTDSFEIIKFVNELCESRKLDINKFRVINNRSVFYGDTLMASFDRDGNLVKVFYV